MKTIRVAFALTIVLFGCVDRAQACQCVPMSLEKHYGAADVVFVGDPTVIRLVETPARYFPSGVTQSIIVEFRVQRWWKGGRRKKVVVRTGIGTGDCGSEFRVGVQYVVFASKKRNGLLTGICSGNTPFHLVGGEFLTRLDDLSEQHGKK